MGIITTVPDLAREWHKSADLIYKLAAKEDDPLPIRYLEGDRYGGVLVSEFEGWLKRNTKLYKERGSR